MKSPFTNGEVTLHTEKRVLEFRKDKFEVVCPYYKCVDTGEEFTTTEQDEMSVNQAYNQYREKYGIPFTDEIRKTAERYGISASKMSKILGFGENQYARYMNGEIPSVSNGRMIASIKDAAEFKKMLYLARNQFSQEEIVKIESKIDALEQESEVSFYEQIIADTTFRKNERSIYTGFVTPQIERVKHIVLFFANKCGGVFETKLNKLMFYSDFLHFKHTGMGLSGLGYRADNYGPVPEKYATVYENIHGTTTEIVPLPYGNAGKKIIATERFDPSLFDEVELADLEAVFHHFEKCTAGQISEISHQELAWIDNNKTKAPIRYDYGLQLKAID